MSDLYDIYELTYKSKTTRAYRTEIEEDTIYKGYDSKQLVTQCDACQSEFKSNELNLLTDNKVLCDECNIN